MKGYFTFILHSHLPYVLSHGKWPHGTDWLNEAAAETYIPLLDVFGQLVAEGISPNVTIGISPILTEQLANKAFKEEFKEYLNQKIDASEDDRIQFEKTGEQNKMNLAVFWRDTYRGLLDRFTVKYGEDLVGAFKAFQDDGHLEIITCAATHGYLPLLLEDECVNAQVKLGVETYKKHYGRQPRGIWLPECAYRPAYSWKPPMSGFGDAKPRRGIEQFLHDHDINYFIVDSHLLKGGKAIGAYVERFGMLKKLHEQYEKEYTQIQGGPNTPYQAYTVASAEDSEQCANVLVRDPKTCLQVWSGEWGYPGDAHYLDFHKKHFPSGNRYWAVTDSKADLADKVEYRLEETDARLRENANHFVGIIYNLLAEQQKELNGPAIICAPFDTELFGHWWFEGPRWMYYVLKQLGQHDEIDLVTGGDYLEQNPPEKIVSLPEGSWGEGGHHFIWLNEWNEWTWRHIYEAERKMVKLAAEHADTDDEVLRRILNQMARELLLMESSDWQFLISTWAARDYAELRLSEHFEDFNKIYDVTNSYLAEGVLSEANEALLLDREQRDCPFELIELKWWT